MPKSCEDIRNGIVLSELAGSSNGLFCSRHGIGASLVMLGTYIIDPGRPLLYPKDFIIKSKPALYKDLLRKEIKLARLSKALVGISVAGIDLKEVLSFFKAAEEQKADFIALCLHSTYGVFKETKTSAALCLKENRVYLREWVQSTTKAVKIPVIFKLGVKDTPDTAKAIEVISKAGGRIIHLNCERVEKTSYGLKVLQEAGKRAEFVIASGNVRNIADVYRLLKSGAGAVAIGRAVKKDPELCLKLHKCLLENQIK